MALSTNKLADVLPLLAEDVTYTVPGNMAISGVFHGPDEVESHLHRLFDFSRCTFDVLKWVDWLVGETHVAAMQYSQIQANGSIYRGHQLFLVEVDSHDKLSDIKVFFEDEAAAARFFAG
jgi:ketosteroid isomerase-like protein